MVQSRLVSRGCSESIQSTNHLVAMSISGASGAERPAFVSDSDGDDSTSLGRETGGFLYGLLVRGGKTDVIRGMTMAQRTRRGRRGIEWSWRAAATHHILFTLGRRAMRALSRSSPDRPFRWRADRKARVWGSHRSSRCGRHWPVQGISPYGTLFRSILLRAVGEYVRCVMQAQYAGATDQIEKSPRRLAGSLGTPGMVHCSIFILSRGHPHVWGQINAHD
jgi:hypothetical protein